MRPLANWGGLTNEDAGVATIGRTRLVAFRESNTTMFSYFWKLAMPGAMLRLVRLK